MTSDDIIRMAREARLAEHTHPYQLWSASDAGLERFANLVAAAEREACAAICDAYGMPDGTSETARLLAHQIRVRGQQ